MSELPDVRVNPATSVWHRRRLKPGTSNFEDYDDPADIELAWLGSVLALCQASGGNTTANTGSSYLGVPRPQAALAPASYQRMAISTDDLLMAGNQQFENASVTSRAATETEVASQATGFRTYNRSRSDTCLAGAEDRCALHHCKTMLKQCYCCAQPYHATGCLISRCVFLVGFK